MTTKTVFITGAASGIGLATARYLSEQGYFVGMADLNLHTLEKVTKNWDHNTFQLYQLDVTNFEQAQAVLANFCQNNSLSILINNAGVLEIGDFQAIANEQHARTLNVNVMGVINLCQAAFEYLKANNGATIINMCSASSDYGVPQFASYSASKFAVKALTEALELEWQEHSIRVCDVIPPFVATDMLASQKNPSRILKRLGVNLSPSDVAQVIIKQIGQPKTHRSVGFQYGLLHTFIDISPSFMRRLIIKYLNRP